MRVTMITWGIHFHLFDCGFRTDARQLLFTTISKYEESILSDNNNKYFILNSIMRNENENMIEALGKYITISVKKRNSVDWH